MTVAKEFLLFKGNTFTLYLRVLIEIYKYYSYDNEIVYYIIILSPEIGAVVNIDYEMRC